MNWPQDPLQINPQDVIRAIVSLIKTRFHQLDRKVAVLGLSGGLDSSLAAALAVQSLGPDKVHLYYLPERDSSSLHRGHARIMAEKLGVDLRVIPITPALKALRIYSLLPLGFFPGRELKIRAVQFGRSRFLEDPQGEFLRVRLNGSGGPWIRRANAYISAKHRVRSVLLYREAERLRGLVIGSANRTEWLTGTFTQFGCDHNADVMPLLHLYRSQLETLAAYLEIPEEIRSKKADPDLLPGLDDKGALLGSFEITDQILWGIENGVPLTELAGRFGQERVLYIHSLVEASAFYREAPYSLL